MTRVLVVDDDAQTREMLRDMLTQEGYRVTVTSDGPVALAHLWATDQPMVVLVDPQLPGVKGTDVVEAYLQAGAPASPREFILLRAGPDRIGAPRNSRTLVVTKPLDRGVLLETVARAAARLTGE